MWRHADVASLLRNIDADRQLIGSGLARPVLALIADPTLAVASWICVFIAGISSATADVLITVDKAAQRMSVSVDGQPIYSWPVSTGRRGYETPTGTFRPSRLVKEHYSKE
jgi:hypothetical protein